MNRAHIHLTDSEYDDGEGGLNWIEKNDVLTVERLRELLSYDPETGIFRWLVSTSNRVRVGDVAGCPNNKGYLRIRIDGRLYFCHRLAHLYMTGEWPSDMVDHKYGRPSDNRWGELRPADATINQQNLRIAQKNNRVGLLGVSAHGSTWRAQITANGKVHRITGFKTPEEAHEAYLKAKRELHQGGLL